MKKTILKEGYNCSRLRHVERLAVLIDADQYYQAFFDVSRKAKGSINILGWEVDSELGLHCVNKLFPDNLRNYLKELADTKKIRVSIMSWKAPLYLLFGRESLARFKWNIGTSHLSYQLVGHTHFYGTHHEKIAVVDGKCAFVGGMDITCKRWDTSQHDFNNPLRKDAKGQAYNPNHDVQVVFTGDLVEELNRYFRHRNKDAVVAKIHSSDDVWPDVNVPTLTNVKAALSSTRVDKVPQIERLYVDAIRAAEKFVYIENQYFSSREVIAALEERLRESDGPEVLVVLPKKYRGKFEKAVYTKTRDEALRRLRKADKFKRLEFCYPDNSSHECDQYIIVHSKILIADNAFMTVGSANLNNRSMRVDSEMNLSVETESGEGVNAFIGDTLFRLTSEHLGTTPEEMRREFDERSSLLRAVRFFQRRNARTLKPVPLIETTWEDRAWLLLRPMVDLRFSFPKAYFFLMLIGLFTVSFMYWQEVP